MVRPGGGDPVAVVVGLVERRPVRLGEAELEVAAGGARRDGPAGEGDLEVGVRAGPGCGEPDHLGLDLGAADHRPVAENLVGRGSRVAGEPVAQGHPGQRQRRRAAVGDLEHSSDLAVPRGAVTALLHRQRAAATPARRGGHGDRRARRRGVARGVAGPHREPVRGRRGQTGHVVGGPRRRARRGAVGLQHVVARDADVVGGGGPAQRESGAADRGGGQSTRDGGCGGVGSAGAVGRRAPHHLPVLDEHQPARLGRGDVADRQALVGPVVGRVPGAAAGEPELHLLAVGRLARRGDAGARDVDVVHVPAVPQRFARGTALVVVGGDGDLVRGGRAVEGEVVAQGAVEHPGGPRGPVQDVGLDLGEADVALAHRRLRGQLGAVRGLGDREARRRGAAVLAVEPGQRAGEPGVVVQRDLVGHVVGAAVGVGVVVRARPADQRAVEHVPAGGRFGDAVGPRPVRGAVVGVARRVGAEPDDVAGAARVVAERVVHLPDGEVVVGGGAGGVPAPEPVAVHQRDERGVGRVPQRPPAVEHGLAARRVPDAVAVVAGGPEVEPAVGVGQVGLLTGQLRHEHVGAVGLVVPGDRPLVGPLGALRLGAELRVLVLGLGEVGGVAGGAVEPDRAPHQLVLVAAPRVVVRARVGDAGAVLAPVGVGEGVELLGVGEQRGGVGRVGRGEHHRRRRQRRGVLAREVGAGAGRVDLVGGARHRHDLGGAPPGVVGGPGADLAVDHVGRRVRLDDPVGAPLEVRAQRDELAGVGVGLPVLHRAPGEHRHAGGEGQPELHVVARVVEAAGQVEADVGAVGQGGVAPPGHAVVGGQLARALRVVEPDRLLQRLAVVERRCRLRGVRGHHQREHREDRGQEPGNRSRRAPLHESLRKVQRFWERSQYCGL